MTTPAQPATTCNAQVKNGRLMHICDLPLRHDGEHEDGTFSWSDQW